MSSFDIGKPYKYFGPKLGKDTRSVHIVPFLKSIWVLCISLLRKIMWTIKGSRRRRGEERRATLGQCQLGMVPVDTGLLQAFHMKVQFLKITLTTFLNSEHGIDSSESLWLDPFKHNSVCSASDPGEHHNCIHLFGNSIYSGHQLNVFSSLHLDDINRM